MGRDERPHTAGPGPWWAETWTFDTTTELGALRVDVVALPNRRVVWYSATLVADGRPYVLCCDDELAYTSQWPIEVRGSGLWMHAICETPLHHWTVAMEAYALAFDDPSEAWRSELGDRVGLAFDLEWEHDDTTRIGGGYEALCRVSGELQLDDERCDVDSQGWRSHRWGTDVDLLIAGDPLGARRIVEAPMVVTTATGRRRLLRWLGPPSDESRPPRWFGSFIE